MTKRLPTGVKAAIKIYLIGEEEEVVTVEIDNLPFIPELDMGEIDPAAIIAACKPGSKEVFDFQGNWRLMSDAEIAKYQREEAEGYY